MVWPPQPAYRRAPGVDFEVTETPAMLVKARSPGDDGVKLSDYEAGGAESLGPPFPEPGGSSVPCSLGTHRSGPVEPYRGAPSPGLRPLRG